MVFSKINQSCSVVVEVELKKRQDPSQIANRLLIKSPKRDLFILF
jgi:hypothetical protein